MTTEGEDGTVEPVTDIPAAEPSTPVVVPEQGTPLEEMEAENPADPGIGGILPVAEMNAELERMTGELEARFQEMYPGQLSEIEAVRDTSFNLSGVHEGWRVDAVLRVRFRRR